MTHQAVARKRQMEHTIETVLMPGRFISYNAGFSFVRGLDAVEQQLSTSVAANPAQGRGPL